MQPVSNPELFSPASLPPPPSRTTVSGDFTELALAVPPPVQDIAVGNLNSPPPNTPPPPLPPPPPALELAGPSTPPVGRRKRERSTAPPPSFLPSKSPLRPPLLLPSTVFFSLLLQLLPSSVLLRRWAERTRWPFPSSSRLERDDDGVGSSSVGDTGGDPGGETDSSLSAAPRIAFTHLYIFFRRLFLCVRVRVVYIYILGTEKAFRAWGVRGGAGGGTEFGWRQLINVRSCIKAVRPRFCTVGLDCRQWGGGGGVK